MSANRGVNWEPAHIEEVLRPHLASLGGAEGGALAVRGPVRRAHYSLIFRAEVPGIPESLAVKCCIDPATGGADSLVASDQFNGLQRVHAAMGAARNLRVPRPYLLLEQEGIVVLEWIDGVPMTDLLLSWRLSPREAMRLMEQSARWLRGFADAHPMPTRRLDVEEKLSVGVASIERSALHREAPVRRALAALRQHADSALSHELEQSWIHGDFKTDNLLVTADALVGIDVRVPYENATVHDVAAFVNHVELTLCHPRAWRLRPWRSRLIGAFIAGYDPGYLVARRVPYHWTALYMMIWNWNEFSGRARKSLKHRYLKACFAAIVARMTTQLHDAARDQGQRVIVR